MGNLPFGKDEAPVQGSELASGGVAPVALHMSMEFRGLYDRRRLDPPEASAD
jgi:hypothetical protein